MPNIFIDPRILQDNSRAEYWTGYVLGRINKDMGVGDIATILHKAFSQAISETKGSPMPSMICQVPGCKKYSVIIRVGRCGHSLCYEHGGAEETICGACAGQIERKA